MRAIFFIHLSWSFRDYAPGPHLQSAVRTEDEAGAVGVRDCQKLLNLH